MKYEFFEGELRVLFSRVFLRNTKIHRKSDVNLQKISKEYRKRSLKKSANIVKIISKWLEYAEGGRRKKFFIDLENLLFHVTMLR